jgi:hypothetical protein
MEFKTIVYIIAGVIWLLSRFLQKEKPEQRPKQVRVPGKPEEAPWSSTEPTPQPVRSVQPRKMPERKPLIIKREVKTAKAFLPEAISLETQSVQPLTGLPVPRLEIPVDQPDLVLTQSEAGRIADEIKNGPFDWRRAVIISELINRKVV